MRDYGCRRRSLIKGIVGAGLAMGASRLGVAAAEEDPKKQRPKAGDHFVYFVGERKGEFVRADALPEGGPQELAYPKDPVTGVVRDGSRYNLVALVRPLPEEITEETAEFAADGVVGYSAICTHQGCPVSMWEDEDRTLFCSCHGSEFVPGDMARIISGPAERRLPILPLAVEEGLLVAAGPIKGTVGPKKF